MDLREIINKNAPLAAGLIGAVAAVAICFGIVQSRHHTASPLQFHTKAFYTCDDGATLFADDGLKVAPFDHEGVEAVRANVYTADGGKTQWVQYLEKQDAKPADAGSYSSGRLVKKPGSHEWVPFDSPRAASILSLGSPDGKAGKVEPVMP